MDEAREHNKVGAAWEAAPDGLCVDDGLVLLLLSSAWPN